MNRTGVLAALASFQDNFAAVIPNGPIDVPGLIAWIRDETVDKETVESLEDQLATAKQWQATATEGEQHARAMMSRAMDDRKAAEAQVQHMQAALEAAGQHAEDLKVQIRVLRMALAIECQREY